MIKINNQFSFAGDKLSIYDYAKLTKWIGVTFLLVSIIAILIVNISARFYATNSGAADDDSANINAPSEISLELFKGTNYVNVDELGDDTPDGNINLIPTKDSGNNGITMGRHYLRITTNAVNGYKVDMSTNNDSTSLVDQTDDTKHIQTTGSPYKSTGGYRDDVMDNNSWGWAWAGFGIPGDVSISAPKSCIPKGNTPETADATKPGAFMPMVSKNDANGPRLLINSQCQTKASGFTAVLYYAIRIDNPNTFPVGTYKNTVVYTATAEPVDPPTIDAVSPNTYQLGNADASTITITGTNLASIYDAYVDINNNGVKDDGEAVTNIKPDTTSPNSKVYVNIPTNAAAGTYNLYLTTQGGNTEQSEVAKITYQENPNACKTVLGETYDSSTNVCVDYDANMIPVKYTGAGDSGWVKADPTNTNNDWFNYSDTAKGNASAKQWANAVTINSTANVTKYQNAAPGTPITNSEIKGFWTYLPRYAYEVMRRDAVDKFVTEQNFDIKFETINDPKKEPAKCTLFNESTHVDYRTECNISRTYGNATGTTWATHPAFTWGDEELNGLWMGKFEMTGSRTAPTVLPNKIANTCENIGTLYSMAKSMGVQDPSNTYGGSTGNTCSGQGDGDLTANPTYNQHNLSKSPSHMIKNSEWGAAAYLSASIYGAGVNNVQINAVWPGYNGSSWNQSIRDEDNQYQHYGVTGCGPNTANSTSTIYHYNWTSSNPCYASNNTYAGSIGQLASTTNNVYGVYDMSGGNNEYVMGNRTSSSYAYTLYPSYYMTNAPTGKYVNLYRTDIAPNFGTKPSWSTSTSELYYNYDVCTWATCGGHALHETTTVQSVSSNNQSWGSDVSYFVISGYPWALRGMFSGNGSSAGVFANYRAGGNVGSDFASRAILVVLPPKPDPTVCRNADPTSSCRVDIDSNMIPITYDSTNTRWLKADITKPGDWYDYSNTNKKWANAVTVTNPNTYKSANPGTPINDNDIKGFWTYIPRYKYQVRRLNASDPVIQPENFNIQFQKSTDEKLTPTKNGDWATHPAFTWGSEELNGLWMGKFEMTGPHGAPTVLPNQVANISEIIGEFYSMAKSIGVQDPSNTYGGSSGNQSTCYSNNWDSSYHCNTFGDVSASPTYNQHNLAKSPSHMIKNSEWGAAAYLSASIYGAGVNNVQINAAGPVQSNIYDTDGQNYPYGLTGCGPQSSGNTSYYSITSTTNCGGDANRTYTGSLGQLASTTNNVYGIYDMSGGNWEYVMGNYDTNNDGISQAYDSKYSMTNEATGKYVNLYPANIFTNNTRYGNWQQCTWAYCGGHALHETLTVQSVNNSNQSWGSDYSYFVYSGNPWALRGGSSASGSYAGVFASDYTSGGANYNFASRAVLVSVP